MDIKYDITEKEKCWYKDICDHSRCNNTFCIRHYKMSTLISMACMEGKQRYPVKLVLDADKIDKEAFLALKDIQKNIPAFSASSALLCPFLLAGSRSHPPPSRWVGRRLPSLGWNLLAHIGTSFLLKYTSHIFITWLSIRIIQVNTLRISAPS